MGVFKKSIFLLISIISVISIKSVFSAQNNDVNRNSHFDFLLFAQVWPISGCIDWEERSDKNTCSLPNKKNWTVHGIWPTKDKTIGPLFCNKSVDFDFNELSPILKDLKYHWTNVRANTELASFWEHEWLKHGTCAMQMKQFETEFKYFYKGLEMNEEYPIASFLADKGIVPGGMYNTMDIFEAVKVKINGNNPALECHKMDDFVNPVLTQISICFDKNLEVIGCDKTHGGIYGRCHGLVEYPGTAERNHGGKSGIVWGVIIGFAVLVSFAIFIIKSKIARNARNHGYEAI